MSLTKVKIDEPKEVCCGKCNLPACPNCGQCHNDGCRITGELSSGEKIVYDYLTTEPQSFPTIYRKTNLPGLDLVGYLTSLGSKGLVESLVITDIRYYCRTNNLV